MLAAFPPPAQSPLNNDRSRGSWSLSTSWPMQSNEALGSRTRSSSVNLQKSVKKPGRRCCGLPLWAAILIAIVLLGIVAAAIIVPIEFLVLRNQRGDPDQSIDNCRASLNCLNGGTNVIAAGSCSCICSNGFTGSNCAIGGAQGCATTNLVSEDKSRNIKNVTLGQAIPRLLADSDSKFSIPLSSDVILAKFNAKSLSCNGQNSLVTFEGRSTRRSRAGNGPAGDGLSANGLFLNAKEKEEYYQDVPTIIVVPI